jgi:hypothetical protein
MEGKEGIGKKIPRKYTLPEDEDVLMEHLQNLGIGTEEDLAARLCQFPEEGLWAIIRDCLLAIRVNSVYKEGKPFLKALEYLYALVRFVEVSRRYPRKKEQGELLEELSSKPSREARQTKEVVKLLTEASENPSNREAARQLKLRSRFYRTADNIQLDVIPIFDEYGNLNKKLYQEYLRQRRERASNEKAGNRQGGEG